MCSGYSEATLARQSTYANFNFDSVWVMDAGEYKLPLLRWFLPHEHILEHTEAVKKTCSSDGNIEYWKCTICSYYFGAANGTDYLDEYQTVVPASHNIRTVSGKEPTCTEEGYSERQYCRDCYETITHREYFDPLGHSWGAWVVEKYPTEEEEGTNARTCSICQSTEMESIAMLEHGYEVYLTDAIDATCTEPGNNPYYTCAGCSRVYKDEACTQETTIADETIAKLGHQWGAEEKCERCNRPDVIITIEGSVVTVESDTIELDTFVFAAYYDADGRMIECLLDKWQNTSCRFSCDVFAESDRICIFFLGENLAPVHSLVEVLDSAKSESDEIALQSYYPARGATNYVPQYDYCSATFTTEIDPNRCPTAYMKNLTTGRSYELETQRGATATLLVLFDGLLEPGCTYTVTIPANSIYGIDESVYSKELAFSFATSSDLIRPAFSGMLGVAGNSISASETIWTVNGVEETRQHIVALKCDGTVVATGYNDDGRCEVNEWTGIVSVIAGNNHTVALRYNGTVVATGWNYYDQCNVSSWRSIVDIAAGNHTVGLKRDGTVVAVGNNSDGQCNVDAWENIIAVAAGGAHTVGLKADGTVVATGLNDNGRCNVSDWIDIVAISASDLLTMGLKADGTVVVAGHLNDFEQEVESTWKDIISVAAGSPQAFGLKSDGTVIVCASAMEDSSEWTDIVDICCGGRNYVGLKSNGTVIFDGFNDSCDVTGWTSIRTPSR